jgi:hypothetical protein
MNGREKERIWGSRKKEIRKELNEKGRKSSRRTEIKLERKKQK